MKTNNLLKPLAIALTIVTATWAQINWSANAISITTAAELRELATQVNSGNNFSERTITLSSNIDLGGTPEWVPIGNTEARAFQGTFDGNGRTVSGIVINNDQDNQAFFGVIGTNGIVRNLGLEVDITAGGTAAALAVINRGTIEICKVAGSVRGTFVSGLVAENRGTVRNSMSLVVATAQFIPEFLVVTSLPLNPVEGQGVRLRVVHRTNSARSTYIDLVYVAPGEFQQGGSHFGNDNTRPVRLTQGFWIGRFPITQAQWQAIMGNNPSEFTGAGREDHPVTMVSWDDISPFMAAIGARFPTEAEWEFAARGGNRRDPFAWAGSDNADYVAWHAGHPDRIPNQTMPVGQLAPNGLGIFDMSGNVGERVSDFWESWATTTTIVVNPTGATTVYARVVRGNCWGSNAESARVARRFLTLDNRGFSSSGFRVAFSQNSEENQSAMATTQTVESFAGGLVGANFGTIENCYSAGIVRNHVFSGTSGGLVGANNGGTITNSFFDSQRSRQSDNDGRGVPRTTAQMRQQATFAQWNLHSIWGMDALMYNGEPFLRAFYPLSRAQFTIDGQRAAVSPVPAHLVSSAMPYAGIMPHTGSPIQPNVQIEYNGQPLTIGTDFRLEFENNTNANNTTPARMRIIGMGDYAGITLHYNFFIIAPRSIASVTLTPNSIPNQTHTGTPIRPNIAIRDFNNAITLREGLDYELNYTNNTNVGTATIEIIGVGDIYTGFRTVNFNIVPPDTYQINDQNTTISGIPTSVTFNGQAHTPSITINHNQHGLLVEDVHYTVSFGANINQGTGTVIITGTGNYSGQITRTFTINRREINQTIIAPIPPQTHADGQEIRPVLDITDGTRTLILGTDFTVTYVNNRNITANAQAQISGIGNYAGGHTIIFAITADGAETDRINVNVVWREPLTFVFNGAYQRPTATATRPDGTPVELTISGAAQNAQTAHYTATATTTNSRYNLIGNTVNFHITRAPISPTLTISDIRVGETLAPQVSGNLGGGTARVEYSDYTSGPWSINAPEVEGTYWARAVIATTTNYLGATSVSVPFVITGVNSTQISVVWGSQTVFNFDGAEHSPSASAIINEVSVPLVVSGSVNAGTHTANARLANPNVSYTLSNTTQEFTILAKPLAETAIDPIGNFPFTGLQVRPNSIVVRDGTQQLVEGVDYEISFGENILGIGSVIATGKGNYSDTSTRFFIISSEGARVVQVIWDEANTNFTFNGQEQYPKILSSGDVAIEILGKQTNAGSFTAVARLATENPNIILANASMPFTIAPKNLTVNWDTDTVIYFNWQAQRPNATARDQDRGVNIPIGVFHNLNGATANNILADEYSVVAMIIACSQDNHVNYRLTTGSVEHKYKIEQRPINIGIGNTDVNVNLLPSNTTIDTIVVTPNLFDNRVNLENLITTLLGFGNFSRDPSTNQYDNISVFGNRRPSVSIDTVPIYETNPSPAPRSSLDLLRYRIYLLTINTGDMTADNYRIADTTFVIRTTDYVPSFIRNRQAGDSRFGIVLENAVVSDLAKISVITPEQASVKLAILDNLGNVVFSETSVRAGLKPAPTNAADNAIIWDLTNPSGRFVANGTYLIIAEATGISGRRFTYSSRIGVNR